MPYTFSKTEILHSVTCPGVLFSIRNPSKGDQIAWEIANAQVLKKIRLMRTELENTWDVSKKAFKDPAASEALAFDLSRAEREELAPLLIKWGLVHIEGIEDEVGSIPAVEVITRAPYFLCDEIYDALKPIVGLPSVIQKNSQSPTTSSVAVGETLKPTTASTVNMSDFIGSDTAKSTLM